MVLILIILIQIVIIIIMIIIVIVILSHHSRAFLRGGWVDMIWCDSVFSSGSYRCAIIGVPWGLGRLSIFWVFIKGGCSRRGVQWMGIVLYDQLVCNIIWITTPCFHCTPLWWVLMFSTCFEQRLEDKVTPGWACWNWPPPWHTYDGTLPTAWFLIQSLVEPLEPPNSGLAVNLVVTTGQVAANFHANHFPNILFEARCLCGVLCLSVFPPSDISLALSQITQPWILVHPVSITRFPLTRFSPGAGLLRDPFVHR